MKTPAEIIKSSDELQKLIETSKAEMIESIKSILRGHDDEFLYNYQNDLLDFVLIIPRDDECSYSAYVMGLHYNEEFDEVGIYCVTDDSDLYVRLQENETTIFEAVGEEDYDVQDESIEMLHYEDVVCIYKTLIEKTKG